MTVTYQVTVAIDFGTSHSGYAFSFMDPQKIYDRKTWPGQEQLPYEKTRTQLLYDSNKSLIKWGSEAGRAYLELRKSPNTHYLFEYFKTQLREYSRNKANATAIINGRSTPFLVSTLITDYLRSVKNLALEHIKESSSGHISPSRILWCITVPAIWTNEEKSLMRTYAQAAGLIGNSADEQERLVIALEPEAAALYCHDNDSGLKPGVCFMVVDCGGGTVDITVHEVLQDRSFKELTKGGGGLYGAKYVDDAFRKYLVEQLPGVINHFVDESPVEYYEMMTRHWEEIKRNFNPETASGYSRFPIVPSLYRLALREYSEVLDNLASKQSGEDTFLMVPKNAMMSFFEQPLRGIVGEIKKQFMQLSSLKRSCDYIYLVGGFSASAVLKQRVEREFGRQVKKVVRPNQPSAAIVVGAAMFALDQSRMRYRVSRLTYGVAIRQTYDEKLDSGREKIWNSHQSVYQVDNRYSIFIHTGDTMEVGQKVVRTFYPTYPDQTSVQFSIYSTLAHEKRYVDEEGMRLEGTVTIPSPNTQLGLNRPIECTMFFGRSEVVVKAYDVSSGQEAKTTIRFSSTYSNTQGGY